MEYFSIIMHTIVCSVLLQGIASNAKSSDSDNVPSLCLLNVTNIQNTTHWLPESVCVPTADMCDSKVCSCDSDQAWSNNQTNSAPSKPLCNLCVNTSHSQAAPEDNVYDSCCSVAPPSPAVSLLHLVVGITQPPVVPTDDPTHNDTCARVGRLVNVTRYLLHCNNSAVDYNVTFTDYESGDGTVSDDNTHQTPVGMHLYICVAHHRTGNYSATTAHRVYQVQHTTARLQTTTLRTGSTTTVPDSPAFLDKLGIIPLAGLLMGILSFVFCILGAYCCVRMAKRREQNKKIKRRNVGIGNIYGTPKPHVHRDDEIYHEINEFAISHEDDSNEYIQPVCSPASHVQPTSSPTGHVHPLGSPAGHVHPVGSPAGHVHPIGPPTGRVQPVSLPVDYLQPVDEGYIEPVPHHRIPTVSDHVVPANHPTIASHISEASSTYLHASPVYKEHNVSNA